MRKGVVVVASIAMLMGIVTSAMALKPIRVLLDGRTISTRGVMIGNDVYVPAKEVAAAFKVSMSYDVRTGVVRFSTAGGAVQLKATEGKVGQWLFNGRTRLLVRSMERKEGKMLATVQIKNAETKKKIYCSGYWADVGRPASSFWFADAQGKVYKASSSFPEAGVELLPGAGVTFTVQVDTPPGATPVKLVLEFDSRLDALYLCGQEGSRSEVFRVLLAAP